MNDIAISRKAIFDEVRRLLGRGFTRAEVVRIDQAIDRALGHFEQDHATPPARRLGSLSEQFESGGRGPGTISGGSGDPGGGSYGIYQLASRSGTVAAFMLAEGRIWQSQFGDAVPGTEAFSRVWQAVAKVERDRFGQAQHDFIERTHYRPAVASVLDATGLDLDSRHPAVRDATWSVAVQHGGAARILIPAVAQADENEARDNAGYDRALLNAIYSHRIAYVLRLAQRSGFVARQTLTSITRNRYPEELKAALAMLDEETRRS